MENKQCTKCLEILALINFHNRGDNKEKYASWCKKCIASYKKTYSNSRRESLKEYRKQYYLNNKEKLTETHMLYYFNNKEKMDEYRKQYHRNHPDKVKQYKIKYKNKPDSKNKGRAYRQKRYVDNTPKIYFITDNEYIKIGYTKNKIASRLAAIKTGNPRELKILYIWLDQPKQKETELHHLFRHLHIAGEWFRYSEEIINFIKNINY